MTLTELQKSIGVIVGIVILQALVLYHFGQPTISASKHIMLWAGDVFSPENSQQLSDWYTFSHIIHGFLFYALFYALFPRMSVWRRLAFSVGIEVAWEILENTPMVIQHYREQALAQGYTGDSIINSLSDSVAMMFGFLVAWRLPIIATILIALGLELWVAFSIRDNLTLNVINLIHQFEFIKVWQAGSH